MLSLTSRDFDANLAELREQVRALAPDRWNSHFDGDLGTVLLELLAHDTSMLTYLIDVLFRETFLDTLRQRESLRHFARLTGYRIRRASAASLEVYAEASAPPGEGESVLIRKGSKVSSRDGRVWEVKDDVQIVPDLVQGTYVPRVTPVRHIIGYGDIKARSQDANGMEVELDALVRIRKGESHAFLCDGNGDRLPTQYNFGVMAGPGHILVLVSQKIGSVFGPPPDQTRREFAVTAVGRGEFDRYPNGFIYLDRPWDDVDDFIGKWRLESRSLTLVEGESREDSFTTPSDVEERRSLKITGSWYPVLAGASEPYLAATVISDTTVDSGIVVSVNGAVWRETSSLLFEGGNEQVFEVDFDASDRAVITFGDGVNGAMIPPSSTVTLSYRTGGGAGGNVPPGSFDTTLTGQLIPGTNASSIYITNPYTSGRGGQDAETLEEAKTNLHRFVRANDRAVTTEDYDYLASNFSDSVGRIALAKAVLHKNAVPREANIIWVYAWAQGTLGVMVPPSLPLKQALGAYLGRRKMITDEVIVVDGENEPVPLYCYFRISPSLQLSDGKEAIRTALFSVMSSQRPGQPLALSKLYEALETVPGVDMALLRTPILNIDATKPHLLLTNTGLEPTVKTRLAVPAYRGSRTVVVENATGFYPGGLLHLVQAGCASTVATVESITGQTILLQEHTLLADDYRVQDNAGRGCEVYNSDLVLVGWVHERVVDVHVTYTTAFPDVSRVDASMAFALREFFTHTLKPEQVLLRSNLSTIVSSISGVSTYQVNLGTFDGTSEVVQPSFREKIVLGQLFINGVSL